jgi:hypothetical protein
MPTVTLRWLAAWALLFCAGACAHGKDDQTICPEYREQRCLAGQECAMNQERGCKICLCKGTRTGPDGKPLPPTVTPPDPRNP